MTNERTNQPVHHRLEGAPEPMTYWSGASETLGAAGYYAVAFDARGHGDSDWATDGNYERDAMMEDLRLVVDQLDRVVGVHGRPVAPPRVPMPVVPTVCTDPNVPTLLMRGGLSDVLDEKAARSTDQAGLARPTMVPTCCPSTTRESWN